MLWRDLLEDGVDPPARFFGGRGTCSLQKRNDRGALIAECFRSDLPSRERRCGELGEQFAMLLFRVDPRFPLDGGGRGIDGEAGSEGSGEEAVPTGRQMGQGKIGFC